MIKRRDKVVLAVLERNEKTKTKYLKTIVCCHETCVRCANVHFRVSLDVMCIMRSVATVATCEGLGAECNECTSCLRGTAGQ